jgi:Domain of unknown function (DUF7025)
MASDGLNESESITSRVSPPMANRVGVVELNSAANDNTAKITMSTIPEAGDEGKESNPISADQSQNGAENLKDVSHTSSSTAKKPDIFTEVFAEAAPKEEEHLYKNIRRAMDALNAYGTYGPAINLFNQEKEDEKLDIRAKQAVLHLTWTDTRIKLLEKEIKTLRRDVDGLPADFEVKKVSKQPVYMHELKRSTLSEFRLNDESKAVPNNQRPAVEVLITDHNVSRFGRSFLKSSDDPTAEVVDTADPKIVPLRRTGTEGILQIPERLRIRSRALLTLLGRISGEELLSVGYTRNIETPAPVVFLKPFKLFVSYEKEIRAEVRELELKIEKEAELAKNATQVAGTKKEIPDYDNSDLLKYLKAVIEFLDIDLRPTFELRRRIKEGTATHIEFQDLWHLFTPGDIVVDPSNESEVFRVLSYTVSICHLWLTSSASNSMFTFQADVGDQGGREILIDKIEPTKKPTPLDGFMLDCYNLNYNGSVYGPKLHTHSIRR